MNVFYHAYCLKNTQEATSQRHLFDLKEIIEVLVTHESAEFKNSFLYQDENLYLLKEDPKKAPHTYFFLVTRDNELVKAINASKISMQDIREKIEKDESIGFGSFVHLAKESCVAFVGQMLSPKIDVFWQYINMYLEKISSPNIYQVIGRPLMATENIERAMCLDRIGKTTMELGRKHSLLQDFKRLLNNNTGEEEIESVQITINPGRGNAKEFLKNLPKYVDDDMEKLVMKAQGDVYSSMTDLFIIGNGGLRDSINPNPRVSYNVSLAIEKRLQNNQALSDKLAAYRRDNDGGVYEVGLPQSLTEILKRRRVDAKQN